MPKGATQHKSTGSNIDQIIGSRLRERRLYKGLSQGELGKRVGITFQQIQKYEKGSNRLSMARSMQLAKVLDCLPSYFFGDETNPNQTKVMESGLDKDHTGIRDLLSTKDGIRLMRAFLAIPSPTFRRACIEVIEAIPNAMKDGRK